MHVAGIMVPEQDYALVGVGFTFTVLASLFVVLRIITRVWVVRSLGGDDGFIVLSMLGTVGFLVAVMEQVRYGLGLPPDPALLSPFIQATTASVIAYTICHLAVKLSISIQCLRIFVTPTARRLFLGFIIFFSIYGTLCLLLTIFTCYPVAKYWDDSIPGKCLDNRAMRYAFAGINIVNDIAILIAPMPFLRHLQIQKRVRIILMCVFAAGGVACIIAIIRLYSLWAYSSVSVPERPVKGIDIAIWSGLECNIAIICACVPALKPLTSRAFPGLVSSMHSSKSYGVGGSSHNYNSITNGSRSYGRSVHDVNHKGIKVQQSFEMKTTTAVDDGDSERNLVAGTTSRCEPEIYASPK